MTDEKLARWAKEDIGMMLDGELREYAMVLKEKAGLYMRAYRTVNTKLRAVEQELERRK